MQASLKQMGTTGWAKLYLTVVTCSFIIFSVTFKNSYNIFAVLLIGSYLSFLSPTIRSKINLSSAEKALIWVILIYIAAFIMEILLFDSSLRILDKPAKALLLIPLILLLNALKVNHRYLIIAFIISSALLFGVALYDKYILSLSRPGSSINAIQFAAIAIAIASVALSLTATFTQNSVKERIILFLMIALAGGGLIAGVFSQSKGSIIAIPIVLALLALLYWKTKNISKIKATTTAIVALILVSIFTYNSSIIERFQISIDNTFAFNEGTNTNTSSGVRLGQWTVALEAGMQSPIIGIGHQPFIDHKNQQVTLGNYGKELLQFDNSHSTYFNTFARRGLIGLISVILFLGFPIYIGITVWRRQPREIAPYAAGLTTFGCVFFIANATQEVIFLNTGAIMYSGLLVILTSLLAERTKALEE
jgi:O-antigen ligase